MLDRLIDTSKTVTKPASWKDAVTDLEVDKIISTLTTSGEDVPMRWRCNRALSHSGSR